jgi:heterodisulfide reductase subunit A
MEKKSFEGLLADSLADSNFGDVMVVGGGISGIKSPAIGGHMAQLDKTYPTNDCSM